MTTELPTLGDDAITEDSISVESGTTPAPYRFKVEVTHNGPYVVHGAPQLSQEFITPDSSGHSWSFERGMLFNLPDPVKLCRCGQSGNQPYCDGSHVVSKFDGTETASKEPLLLGAKVFLGPGLDVTDNQKFCVYARFCDAKGQVWNLIPQTQDQGIQDTVIHQTAHCPGGRLLAWDHSTHIPHEPHLSPSLCLIEDPALNVSAGLWVRGGIRIQAEDKTFYEIRNRVVLCRCGNSLNKPFCDGSHASSKWQDGLPERTRQC